MNIVCLFKSLELKFTTLVQAMKCAVNVARSHFFLSSQQQQQKCTISISLKIWWFIHHKRLSKMFQVPKIVNVHLTIALCRKQKEKQLSENAFPSLNENEASKLYGWGHVHALSRSLNGFYVHFWIQLKLGSIEIPLALPRKNYNQKMIVLAFRMKMIKLYRLQFNDRLQLLLRLQLLKCCLLARTLCRMHKIQKKLRSFCACIVSPRCIRFHVRFRTPHLSSSLFQLATQNAAT